MALRRELDRLSNVSQSQYAILRITHAQLAKLERHVFQRYPGREWGTFFRFGYRRTAWGLALSYVEPLLPGPDDLDRRPALTRFRDQYSRRAFQTAASSPLAVGVVHSHPQGYCTLPSILDDDMDQYFARELSAYSGGAPYCSLILQRSREGALTFTARVCDRGEWLPVETLIAIGETIERWQSEANPTDEHGLANGKAAAARARARAVLGEPSLKRMAAATVGIVGCSGTGSPAAHVLVRGGVGGYVVVDPQRFEESNLERIHGSVFADAQSEQPPYKVKLMQELILSINPAARLTAIVGNVLQDNVLDELLRCDCLAGCVDTEHGRAVFSDLAQHFLLPTLDVGLLMDGKLGKVTNQLIEFNQWLPELSCAFCDGRIDSRQLSYELMTDQERREREELARLAEIRGDNPDGYWRRPRQLHTVGYLATTAGAMAAGYIEGWLTGTFRPPHPTFQFDLAQVRLGVVAPPRIRSAECSCGRHVGWGDLARSYRNVALPSHWPRRGVLLARSER